MIGRGRNLSEVRDEIVLDVRGSRLFRLDRYVRDNLAWKSRTRIQRLIRSGHVRLNGKLVKPSQLVRAGDVITISLSHGTGMPDYSRMQIAVLYEDPWLLAINKPAGLLVHPVGRHVYDTLMNYLHYRYRDAMGSDGTVHPRLCHRIDRDTTGVLLVGKDRYVHQSVQWQLEDRRVAKEYLALVEGAVDRQLTLVDRPLGEGRDLPSALAGPVLRPSQTRLRVVERLTGGDRGYTLVAANPITGRQNQIRVHLASVGHPVVGDVRYGATAVVSGFPARFLLHARSVRFYHPRLKSSVELTAPLPGDLDDLLARLREVESETAAQVG